MADALELVGRTPLVELRHCSPRPEIRLFAKLEGQNPTGSIKDRIVAYMLQRALAEGRLQQGQEIVEATTGNTGISLAMIGRQLGHKVRTVVPESVFPDLARALQAYGAEVQWVPPSVGIKSAIEVAKSIAAEEGCFLLDQFASPLNPECHYETTGPEILKADIAFDAIVAGLGTGGTVTGIGRRLRESNPALRIIAAEPHPGNNLQGLRSLDDGYVPPILDLSLLDAKIVVRSASAFRATRELLAREGILAGLSSGAAFHAALKWSARLKSGNILMVFADSGWKYLGSPAFDLTDPPTDEEESLDDILWW